MKYRRLILAVALLAASALACDLPDFGGDVDAGDPSSQPPAQLPAATQPSVQQPPPTQPPSTGGGGGGSATVTLYNNSSETVCYVRISPTTNEYWGDDWLGSTETIAPGDTRSFSVDPGVYDLRAEDCSSDEIAVEWEVNISGSYNWNVTGGSSSSGPSTSGGALDYTLEPNFGEANLSAGFTPDPHTTNIVSGGSVDIYDLGLGSGCTGYATSAPDYRLNLSGSSSQLRIFFVADDGDDTTLVINTASGGWVCNDDASGLDPMVELNNPPAGQYDIWVGSYSSSEFINGTLYITELSYDPGDF